MITYGDKVRIINALDFWNGLEGIIVGFYHQGLDENADRPGHFYKILFEHGNVEEGFSEYMIEKCSPQQNTTSKDEK